MSIDIKKNKKTKLLPLITQHSGDLKLWIFLQVNKSMEIEMLEWMVNDYNSDQLLVRDIRIE